MSESNVFLNYGYANLPSSAGLGLATSLAILACGGNISILDISPPPSSSTAGLLHDASRTLYTHTNVTQSASIQAAVNATVVWVAQTGAALGGIVASAGIGGAERVLPRQPPGFPNEMKEARTISMELFDRILAVNLRGTIDLLRLALPHLAAVEGEGPDGERGVCVLVSSVAAFEGQVGQLAYSASKAAIAGVVLPLAREIGQTAGIRVVGIAPGMFQTAMTSVMPKKEEIKTKEEALGSISKPLSRGMIEYPARLGMPGEFAAFVMELIRNPMLNGSVFRLDGAARFPSKLS